MYVPNPKPDTPGQPVAIGVPYTARDPDLGTGSKPIKIVLAVTDGKCVAPYHGIVWAELNPDGTLREVFYDRNGLAEFYKEHMPNHGYKVNMVASVDLFYFYVRENRRLFVNELVSKTTPTTPYDERLVGPPTAPATVPGFKDRQRLTPFVSDDPEVVSTLASMKNNSQLSKTIPPSAATFMKDMSGFNVFDAACYTSTTFYNLPEGANYVTGTSPSARRRTGPSLSTLPITSRLIA